MKNIFLILGSIMILVSCAKPDIHDPNAQIQVSVDSDKYIIPLNYIVRPDTGSYASFETDTGLGYFFWPSGRGLANEDKNPNVLEYDDDIIKFNWTAVNSGIIGNDMPTRVNIVKETALRDIKHDSFGLEAHDDSEGEFSYKYYIGNVYPNSPTTIQCNTVLNENRNSICQMEYLHPIYNNSILLEFSRKNLSDWQAINKMAIDYMEKWHQE